MARIRYLKPEFFEDEDIAELSYEHRLLFQGLWNLADKEGKLEDRPKKIQIKIFPYDKVDIHKGLSALCKHKKERNRPFIVRYEIDGEKYIKIVNWHKHQKPHHTEKDSIIPDPPKDAYTLDNGDGKDNGEGECLESKTGLPNGSLTVKKKNPYAESVTMTEDQYKTLIKKNGKFYTEKAIYVLNNYKQSNGKKYKSDYHTILNWVMDKTKKDFPRPDPDVNKVIEVNREGLKKLAALAKGALK